MQTQLVSLVTGGAGFIGSHIAKQLIQDGHTVVILDDLSGGFQSNIPAEAIFRKGSITSVPFVNALFDEFSFDYVYHLAAYAAEGLSHFIRKFNYENNLIGSIHLINASVNHSIKCFIFASSIAVYGTQKLPLCESQQPQPEDPYGIAKYAVEQDLKAAHTLFGLNSIIFRPHNVFGPHQNIGDPYRNVIGIFMNQLLQNKALSIFGDGLQTRAFTYIDDVAPYIAQSYKHKAAYNRLFNIGADTHCTVKQLAVATAKVMNKTLAIDHLEAREEVVHAYADHTSFIAAFNPKPTTPLLEGLAQTYQWVLEHGARESSTFEAIEITKNLPPSWQ